MRYFQPLYGKLGINGGSVRRSKELAAQQRKQDQQQSFLLFALICVVFSYFISLKF